MTIERITDVNEIEKIVFIGLIPKSLNERLPALRKGNWRIGYNCIYE